ncbi:MAG: cytoplasmic protein [Candidatus Kerfeldbacteria bacterium RIFOXYA2_FULL_38_24]|uniref:Cytoplasmic protein n=1 Tax=Candidatus Kerfeldbacteria bacterium RIFOXYB2_FULL_38_14 TaxID=1798547 RepID=A0A1G2BC99_9BACT|nr:MAG: cytoplasmic protein [Candidatus Kerfeldbacteria bacterium RIFOXYA2_FULL_38_24]OGY86655.1 MAG: cytoplasmic protein [Candidatus Kerfeldbacteria bacterium RIFOXYB2_FULL_38_14]OGY88541.1 MAG: cytoplasmic protein [Candidatus Kerfeldbacteria bacterium RIFOXYC2_FULL_38_9]
MNNFLKKIIGDFADKKEWRAMEARAKMLPDDYRFAYKEIKRYLWKSSGLVVIDPFKNLLDMFEEGVANGKQVLEITGKDVAAFCDELVRGEKTYTEKWREALNRDIAKKLKKQ